METLTFWISGDIVSHEEEIFRLRESSHAKITQDNYNGVRPTPM